MGKYNSNRAIAYRNSRAVFLAISLSFILIWALFLKNQGDNRTFLETQKIMATVQEINIKQATSSRGTTSYFVKLQLPDGKHIIFMPLKPPPITLGSKVPILVDIYDNGTKYYHYNSIDWYVY